MFDRTIVWQDKNGSPVDLTGYSGEMDVREKAEDAAALISMKTSDATMVLGGAAGTIQLIRNATTTAALDFDRAVYDLELYPATVVADAIGLLQGQVFFKKEVTRV